MKLKLIVENFDYDKGEKIKFEHLQKEMMGPRGGFPRGAMPRGRGMRGRGRGFPRGGHHPQMPMNQQQFMMEQMMQQQRNMDMQNMQNMQIMPNMPNNPNQNIVKLTLDPLLNSLPYKILKNITSHNFSFSLSP